jgi:hypothetical protein
MATWKVTRIETANSGNLNGVIVKCTFDVMAFGDNTRHGYAFGEVDLLPPAASKFVALDDVTHELAVSWVKDALGDKVAEYEAKVQGQVDNQAVPAPSVALPWRQ